MIKRKIKFEDYKKHLENNEIMSKSKQRFKSEAHNAFLEKVNDKVMLHWVQVMKSSRICMPQVLEKEKQIT